MFKEKCDKIELKYDNLVKSAKSYGHAFITLLDDEDKEKEKDMELQI